MGNWQISAVFPQQIFQFYGVLQGITQGIDIWLAGPEVFEQPVQFLPGTAQVVPLHADTSAAFTLSRGQELVQEMIQVGGKAFLSLGLDQIDLLLSEPHSFMSCLCLSVKSSQGDHPLNDPVLQEQLPDHLLNDHALRDQH